MPRSTKLLFGLGILMLSALMLPMSNLLAGGASGTALSAKKPADARLAEVSRTLEGKCAFCHVTGTPRPFYARLPVASSMVEADVTEGLRDFDLVAELHPSGGVVSEPALARLELELEEGSMPPAKFVALHWNGRLSVAERGAVLGWVRETRAKVHAVAGVPEKLRAAVLRPIPAQVAVDARKVALGEKLYHDKRLSGDGTVSCASCHDLSKGGTDQAKVSTGIRGQKGGINAPTVFNAALQIAQFWDGRAKDLADQAAGPPANPIEMGATWEGIVSALGQDAAFAAEMQAVYADGVTKANITGAIAEFERTLLTPGSQYDRYLQGEAGALSSDGRRGAALFKSRRCATCHVGELLGGRSYELMGRRADYFGARGKPTDADDGRFSVTKLEADRHRFKVPTLRNVARTSPFFHDGSQAKLSGAVEVMARYQVGVTMTPAEVADVVAFLEALTGEYQGKAL